MLTHTHTDRHKNTLTHTERESGRKRENLCELNRPKLNGSPRWGTMQQKNRNAAMFGVLSNIAAIHTHTHKHTTDTDTRRPGE